MRTGKNHVIDPCKSRLATVIKGCLGTTVVAGIVASSVAYAGPKIEFGEESWLSVGAGLRSVVLVTEDGAPNGTSNGTDFDIEHIRLYVDGQLNKTIGFTFNTDEIFRDGPVDVLDAIARFEFSEAFNLWFGRMLTPADRIEMSGPFFGLSWNQYTQPLYPSDQGGDAGTFGRDDGITVWGWLNKFQYSAGVFNGLEGFSNQSDDVLVATRLAYNFLNKEQNPGYYTSSTYYGALGNIFTLAFSFQSQSGGSGNINESGDFSGYTVDLLSETVLDSGGVLNIEAEYKEFDSDFTIATQPASVSAAAPCFCLFDGDSYFATVAYLFPGAVGPGKFQPYVRYVENSPSDDASSDLTELGLNYVIKGHNARLNLNFGSGDANITGYPGADVDSVSFGVQVQI